MALLSNVVPCRIGNVSYFLDQYSCLIGTAALDLRLRQVAEGECKRELRLNRFCAGLRGSNVYGTALGKSIPHTLLDAKGPILVELGSLAAAPSISASR